MTTRRRDRNQYKWILSTNTWLLTFNQNNILPCHHSIRDIYQNLISFDESAKLCGSSNTVIIFAASFHEMQNYSKQCPRLIDDVISCDICKEHLHCIPYNGSKNTAKNTFDELPYVFYLLLNNTRLAFPKWRYLLYGKQ